MKSGNDDGSGSSSRLYLLARTEDNEEAMTEKHEWYAIEDENCPKTMEEKEEKSVLITTPVSGMGHSFRRGTRQMICVLGGSRICVLGGYDCNLDHVPFQYKPYKPAFDGDCPSWLANDFWYLDVDVDEKDGLLRSNNGWNRGPGMGWGRAWSRVTCSDGKIYVLGGEQTLKGPYNEVYDSWSNKWSPFLQDFCKENDACRAVQVDRVVDGRKQSFLLLYVLDKKSLYEYNIATEDCKLYDDTFGFRVWRNSFVVTCNQNVLATYCDRLNLVCGYKIDKKEWSVVQGLDVVKWVLPNTTQVPDSEMVEAYLFPIGNNGKLCLIWGFKYGHLLYSTYYFHYTKFTVEEADDGILHAQVEPVRSFHIDDIAEFKYCCAL